MRKTRHHQVLYNELNKTSDICSHKGKVFGIGLPKSGTSSTTKLLKNLGYPYVPGARSYNVRIFGQPRFLYLGLRETITAVTLNFLKIKIDSKVSVQVPSYIREFIMDEHLDLFDTLYEKSSLITTFNPKYLTRVYGEIPYLNSYAIADTLDRTLSTGGDLPFAYMFPYMDYWYNKPKFIQTRRKSLLSYCASYTMWKTRFPAYGNITQMPYHDLVTQHELYEKADPVMFLNHSIVDWTLLHARNYVLFNKMVDKHFKNRQNDLIIVKYDVDDSKYLSKIVLNHLHCSKNNETEDIVGISKSNSHSKTQHDYRNDIMFQNLLKEYDQFTYKLKDINYTKDGMIETLKDPRFEIKRDGLLALDYVIKHYDRLMMPDPKNAGV